MQQQQQQDGGEYRLDARDGRVRTLEGFLQVYGGAEGYERWKQAGAPAPAGRPDAAWQHQCAAAAALAPPAPAPIIFMSENGAPADGFASGPCSAPGSAFSPSVQSLPELRVDPADGCAYPLEDFLVQYGEEGQQRWAEAMPLTPRQRAQLAAQGLLDAPPPAAPQQPPTELPAVVVSAALAHASEELGIEYECASYGDGQPDVVRITRCIPGGAFERAGVPTGLLSAMAGREVRSIDDLRQSVGAVRAQQVLAFDVVVHPDGEPPRAPLAVGTAVSPSPPRSLRSPSRVSPPAAQSQLQRPPSPSQPRPQQQQQQHQQQQQQQHQQQQQQELQGQSLAQLQPQPDFLSQLQPRPQSAASAAVSPPPASAWPPSLLAQHPQLHPGSPQFGDANLDRLLREAASRAVFVTPSASATFSPGGPCGAAAPPPGLSPPYAPPASDASPPRPRGLQELPGGGKGYLILQTTTTIRYS